MACKLARSNMIANSHLLLVQFTFCRSLTHYNKSISKLEKWDEEVLLHHHRLYTYDVNSNDKKSTSSKSQIGLDTAVLLLSLFER